MIKIANNKKAYHQVKEALEAAQGVRKKFILRCPEQVFTYADQAEYHLESLGIKAKERPGACARFMVRPRGRGGYPANAEVTVVNMERKAAGWYVTSIETASPSAPGDNHRGVGEMLLTEEQQEAALQNLKRIQNVKF